MGRIADWAVQHGIAEVEEESEHSGWDKLDGHKDA